MYGISVWSAVTFFFLLRRRTTAREKNVTLFSYMVMQHAAHLEIYPLIYTVRHGLDVTEESLLEEEEERRGAR